MHYCIILNNIKASKRKIESLCIPLGENIMYFQFIKQLRDNAIKAHSAGFKISDIDRNTLSFCITTNVQLVNAQVMNLK